MKHTFFTIALFFCSGLSYSQSAMLKNINPGSASSMPEHLTSLKGELFFVADDGVHGRELWKSGGTASTTFMLKDINSGPAQSFISKFTEYNGKLYFVADDGIRGNELWVTDGTESGTQCVIDMNSKPSGAAMPGSLIVIDGELIFAAMDYASTGYRYWKTDGTAQGTKLFALLDFVEGGRMLGKFNGNYVFLYDDDSYGQELWKSDGTLYGTSLLKDIDQGTGSSQITECVSLGAMLYFSARDQSGGNELWRTDGTVSGTVRVKDINEGPVGSEIKYLTVFQNKLYFNATDTLYNSELWVSDGTEEGTQKVKEINPGLEGSNIQWISAASDYLLLSAKDAQGGNELWMSKGTEASTFLLKELRSGSDPSFPSFPTVSGSAVYFSAISDLGFSLCITNGTADGTSIKQSFKGLATDWPRNLTLVGKTLFFTTTTDSAGTELWSYSTENSVRQISFDNDVSVYPVPVKDFLTIESASGSIESVKVFDVQGRQVKQEAFESALNVLQLDLTVLNAGVYVLEITNADGLKCLKKIQLDE